ncbi:MAG: thioredoxin domain-containing protein [Kiritimatiellae bacterium]|nr:thioredoxin domain-containing protein [Kiritimatiellia bacterium]
MDPAVPANRLASEKSPYLLQHARNPVNWYPWDDAAFETARAQDKPIFLSIGYSTCHWCHVMEKESFEDAEVAALLNAAFVCVKVDREERPAVDHVYMQVCQALTGSGGWPLTIVMTPEREPFFAATYIPKHARFGRPGLLELLPRIAELWARERGRLVRAAGEIVAALQADRPAAGGPAPGREALDAGFNDLARQFDNRYAGFGTAPKFPTAHNVLFLLRYWKRTGDTRALDMAERTLQAMRDGGVYDQLGFGFHRYATDEAWRMPHFEKMLYDQALLAEAYTEAWLATGTPVYRQTAEEIFEYVRRDMTDGAGGFYSAEDADSEGEEGRFYLWTADEMRRVLPADEFALAERVWGVRDQGNFRDPVHGGNRAFNILHRSASTRDTRGARPQAPVDRIRRKLLAHREKRSRPHKDDKILTDWNGLMIAALAKGSRAFGEPRYAERAAAAANFVLGNMRRPDGRLLHRYRDGQAAIEAHADDYAFLLHGLVELYQATFQTAHLKVALELAGDMLARFRDDKAGGLFLTSADADPLFVRPKASYDSAIPAANSVAALVLLQLAHISGRPDLADEAESLIRSAVPGIERHPAGHTQMLVALDFAIGPAHELVIAGRPGDAGTDALLEAARGEYLPRTVILLRSPERDDAALAPFAAPLTADDGQAVAFVCSGFTCRLPTTDPARMLDLLRK